MNHEEFWECHNAPSVYGKVAEICTESGERIVSDIARPIARRIVACHNACAGIPIEMLEENPASIAESYAAGLRDLTAERDALRREVAELTALIKQVQDDHDADAEAAGDGTACDCTWCAEADAALAQTAERPPHTNDTDPATRVDDDSRWMG